MKKRLDNLLTMAYNRYVRLRNKELNEFEYI